MNGLCMICGAEATHHHKYCDAHYPEKSATILFLKNRNRELVHENESLRNQLAQIKRVPKGKRNKYQQLLEAYKTLRGEYDEIKNKVAQEAHK